MGVKSSDLRNDPWCQKTRMMGLSDGERISMIRSAVLIQYTRVTDGQTDGIGVAYTHYSIYAVARKNLITIQPLIFNTFLGMVLITFATSINERNLSRPFRRRKATAVAEMTIVNIKGCILTEFLLVYCICLLHFNQWLYSKILKTYFCHLLSHLSWRCIWSTSSQACLQPVD